MGVLSDIRRFVLGSTIAEIGCSGFLTEAGLGRIVAAVDAAVPPQTLVDVGCGTGGLGLYVAKAVGCRRVRGFDADPNCIIAARASATPIGVDVSFETRAFDDQATIPAPSRCEAGVALDSLYLADELQPALRGTSCWLSAGAIVWIGTYVGTVDEGGVHGRTPRQWRTSLQASGFSLEEVIDTSVEWREHGCRIHSLRLEAAERVLTELGPIHGSQALAISRRMLGLDGRRAFLKTVRRIEIVARRA